jgi:hypothetical protein
VAEWVWRCGCMGFVLRRRARVCPFCGETSMDGGWEYEPKEAMAVYQYVTGLKPDGEHREPADESLDGLRAPCGRCGGTGLLTLPYSRHCACPECEGTGGFWKAPFAEVEAVLARIVERYPDAALEETPARFREGGLRFDEKRCAVVERRRPVRRATGTHRSSGTAAVSGVREPSAFETPTKRSSPARRRREPGVSCDGLRFADVTEAFRAAEEALGTEWNLKGRNHCERVSLRGRYSRHAAARTSCWQRFYPHGSMKLRTVFPRAVVLKAAETLGVHPNVLIAKEW